MRTLQMKIPALALFFLISATAATAEDWPQFKYDCRHSGNVPDRSVTAPLGLVGAIALTDAVLTSPVVADGRVYVVDGSGIAFCIEKSDPGGGKANCNNVSSPAIAGRYLHFGTMAGSYCVLDRATGDIVKKIMCGEPVLSAPVMSEGRVYFATLGSRVYAIEPDGTAGRVTWRDQFCCSGDIVADGKMLVIPAGGSGVCLEDKGNRAEHSGMAAIPSYAGSEKPATLGLSIGENGLLYRQWHRRDNTGRVEIISLRDGQKSVGFVPATLTEINRPGLLSFCSVSVRGQDVYRCRPEGGFGFCKHSPG
ncbi:MAG: outer membrane protein assembly factor BamB family protein, partial [Planctomycetota bacterium]